MSLRKAAFALACMLPFVSGAAKAADIVTTAQDAGQFSTLVQAVEAAGLTETLTTGGPFTVFAPTDDAFAKLPAGTLDSLLEPANRDQLVSILTYHVLPDRLAERDFRGAVRNYETVQGSDVRVNAVGEGIFVNDAHVIDSNVAANQSIIHAIDTVLMP